MAMDDVQILWHCQHWYAQQQKKKCKTKRHTPSEKSRAYVIYACCTNQIVNFITSQKAEIVLRSMFCFLVHVYFFTWIAHMAFAFNFDISMVYSNRSKQFYIVRPHFRKNKLDSASDNSYFEILDDLRLPKADRYAKLIRGGEGYQTFACTESCSGNVLPGNDDDDRNAKYVLYQPSDDLGEVCTGAKGDSNSCVPSQNIHPKIIGKAELVAGKAYYWEIYTMKRADEVVFGVCSPHTTMWNQSYQEWSVSGHGTWHVIGRFKKLSEYYENQLKGNTADKASSLHDKNDSKIAFTHEEQYELWGSAGSDGWKEAISLPQKYGVFLELNKDRPSITFIDYASDGTNLQLELEVFSKIMEANATNSAKSGEASKKTMNGISYSKKFNVNGFGFKFEAADFSSALPGVPLIGNIVPSKPIDACEPLVGNYENTIVLAKRGSCDFAKKVLNIQNGGGIAAVIYNHKDNKVVLMTADRSYRSQIKIPAIFIGLSDGMEIQYMSEHMDDDADHSSSKKGSSPAVAELCGGMYTPMYRGMHFLDSGLLPFVKLGNQAEVTVTKPIVVPKSLDMLNTPNSHALEKIKSLKSFITNRNTCRNIVATFVNKSIVAPLDIENSLLKNAISCEDNRDVAIESNSWVISNCLRYVNCGAHFADSCAECPGDHGKNWCNGECHWNIHLSVCELNHKSTNNYPEPGNTDPPCKILGGSSPSEVKIIPLEVSLYQICEIRRARAIQGDLNRIQSWEFQFEGITDNVQIGFRTSLRGHGYGKLGTLAWFMTNAGHWEIAWWIEGVNNAVDKINIQGGIDGVKQGFFKDEKIVLTINQATGFVKFTFVNRGMILELPLKLSISNNDDAFAKYEYSGLWITNDAHAKQNKKKRVVGTKYVPMLPIVPFVRFRTYKEENFKKGIRSLVMTHSPEFEPLSDDSKIRCQPQQNHVSTNDMFSVSDVSLCSF